MSSFIFFFHLPPIPLVVLFQSSSRPLFVLSFLLDIKALFLWSSLPSLHIFPKWSPFPPMASLPSMCWWLPRLNSVLSSELDVLNKHLRDYLMRAYFLGMASLSTHMWMSCCHVTLSYTTVCPRSSAWSKVGQYICVLRFLGWDWVSGQLLFEFLGWN